jgi:L-lactate dehydrogenase complex protein LldG
MPEREHILHKVRTALGRSAGQAPALPPEPRLRLPAMTPEGRVAMLLERFAGKAWRAPSAAGARDYVAELAAGKSAIASPAALLGELGILDLPGVRVARGSPEQIRQDCATADLGITTAAYAMADTGALVVLATGEESRLVSLLPPVHVTVLPAGRVLSSLDELFTVLPDPAAASASMVLIAGPSRTADIEQILTLGVHGPRELGLVVV